MTRPMQALAELDAKSAEAVQLADEYERKLATLERNGFSPPPAVVPVDGGWQIHLPGRVPGTVAQVAQIFPTKRDAQQALRRFQRGDGPMSTWDATCTRRVLGKSCIAGWMAGHTVSRDWCQGCTRRVMDVLDEVEPDGQWSPGWYARAGVPAAVDHRARVRRDLDTLARTVPQGGGSR